MPVFWSLLPNPRRRRGGYRTRDKVHYHVPLDLRGYPSGRIISTTSPASYAGGGRGELQKRAPNGAEEGKRA